MNEGKYLIPYLDKHRLLIEWSRIYNQQAFLTGDVDWKKKQSFKKSRDPVCVERMLETLSFYSSMIINVKVQTKVSYYKKYANFVSTDEFLSVFYPEQMLRQTNNL